MRQFVYKQQEGEDWGSLLYIANSFVTGARVEWAEVANLWGPDQRDDLKTIVNKAALVAEVETIDSLFERIPTVPTILKQFDTLQILEGSA